jgi:kynurenine formamidase
MKIVDLTGPIYTGMWYFGEPWKRFTLNIRYHELPAVGIKALIEDFDGMNGHCGLHIETPATGLGYEQSYPLSEVPVEKLVHANAYLYFIPHERLPIKDGKPYISLEALKEVEKGEVEPNSIILVGTGYGKNWDREDYLSKSWFFKREAMYYLIDKKPFLLGVDATDFENWANPEKFMQRFFGSDILLMAPLVNLEKIGRFRLRVTALPLKIKGAAICPTRAVAMLE